MWKCDPIHHYVDGESLIIAHCWFCDDVFVVVVFVCLILLFLLVYCF